MFTQTEKNMSTNIYVRTLHSRVRIRTRAFTGQFAYLYPTHPTHSLRAKMPTQRPNHQPASEPASQQLSHLATQLIAPLLTNSNTHSFPPNHARTYYRPWFSPTRLSSIYSFTHTCEHTPQIQKVDACVTITHLSISLRSLPCDAWILFWCLHTRVCRP